jgi:hypothetical protein
MIASLPHQNRFLGVITKQLLPTSVVRSLTALFAMRPLFAMLPLFAILPLLAMLMKIASLKWLQEGLHALSCQRGKPFSCIAERKTSVSLLKPLPLMAMFAKIAPAPLSSQPRHPAQLLSTMDNSRQYDHS